MDGALHTMLLLSCENRFSAQSGLCNIWWAVANSRGCHVVEVVESTCDLFLWKRMFLVERML